MQHLPLPDPILPAINPRKHSLLSLMALAIHDAKRPLTYEEIQARLLEIGVERPLESFKRAWHGKPLIRKTSDGRLSVMKAEGCWSLLIKNVRLELDETAEIEEKYRVWRATEGALTQAWYRTAKKAVMRCLFDGQKLLSAVVLDPDTRQFGYFVDAPSLAKDLGYRDFILGLDPRADFERIGFTPSERSVLDLTPPCGARRLANGRVKEFSANDVIRMTLGVPRPLEDQRKHRDLFNGPGHKKVWILKRLKRDVKVLWNFYEYGCLHGFVRLHWRQLNELYAVFWDPGRQPTMSEILEEGRRAGKAVDVVIGHPPSWDDPWEGSFRVNVLGGSHETFVLRLIGGQKVEHVWVGHIFAARVVWDESRGGG